MTTKQYINRNIDLKDLIESIEVYLKNDGYEIIYSMTSQLPFAITARKVSAMRSITGTRNSIAILIEGNGNNFHITTKSGEWGKNLAAVGLWAIATVGIGGAVAAGMTTFNKMKSSNDLWNIIERIIVELSNSLHAPTNHKGASINYCINCGREISDKIRYCPGCGTLQNDIM